MSNEGTEHAPEGTVWVCGACGKRATTRNGWDAENRSTAIDRGWDTSCATWAVLCYETTLVFQGSRLTGAQAVVYRDDGSMVPAAEFQLAAAEKRIEAERGA